MFLREFILEERRYSSIGPLLILLLIDGTPSLGQSIILALSMTINDFSFKVTQAQSEKLAKFQSKNITFFSYGID